jgi:hypothetical protein
MLKESVLNVEVSCFKNYDTPQDPKTINLMIWLTSTKYKDKVESIRSNNNKKERDSCKATLPAITPSGIFSYRRQDNLINHSGLIQIDIDLTEKNKLISNWENLKSELTKLPNIAYLGRSVSGRGYWGLIPIPPDPDGHKLYFDSLKDIFLLNWGIELDDKPKNVASLRGYSFDEEAYFNHHAKPFQHKKESHHLRQVHYYKNTGTKTSGLENSIIRKLEASPEGQRHGDRLKLARYAGGLVANGYLDSQICEQLIKSYLTQFDHIDSPHTQAKEIKAIRDGYKDGLKYPTHPSKVNCLLVPIKKFEDYSEKSFKIWQGIKSYFIPKSQVYEILESGFYITESFLRSNPKPPKWQGLTTEFNFYAVCQYKINSPTKSITNLPTPEDYISQLYFENGLLMNEDKYPAEWDLAGSYTDQKSKAFIRLAAKNPLIIGFRNKFDLS